MKRLKFPAIGMILAALFCLASPQVDAGSNCNSNSCDSGGCGLLGGLGCGSLCDGKVWLSGEYLLWQTSGMKIPPLVTGNPYGTPTGEAGVIGVPSTQILLGNQKILEDVRSGLRFSGGMTLTERLGVEGEFFWLDDANANYSFGSETGLIIGRPFINLAPLAGPIRWDTQLVDVPNVLEGRVDVSAYSKFWGAGGRLRLLACESWGCDYQSGGCDSCCDSSCGQCCKRLKHSFLVTLGYRYLCLEDGLYVDEYIRSASDEFAVWDKFKSKTAFNGLDLGLEYNCFNKCISLTTFGRFAVGVNQSEISIDGITEIDGVRQLDRGGILAQASNIGTDEFTMASFVSQIGIRTDMQLTECLFANFGYSFLYWGNVVRAGEQIDTHVNPGLFPPYTVPPGTIGAQPKHKLSDYFAHGLNAGITVAF